MNDIEMRRSILQYAFDHRLEHQLRIVSIGDMTFLKDVSKVLTIENIRHLIYQGLIKTEDNAWTIISITTPGITLVENRDEFDRRFPVRYDIPDVTKKLVDCVETLLTPRFIAPLNQFKKASEFLYGQQPTDCLNSIKEAVGAVEGLARAICGQPNATLSKLSPVLKRSYLSHPAMEKIIESIYAVRGDELGIAHGANESSAFGYADAEFMLNVSASIIIYLARKTQKSSQ
jgi:hypothetical protein